MWYWYKDVLSDFRTEEKQKELHKNDECDYSLIDKKTGTVKTVWVPILEVKNLGKNMGIDDKNIQGETYTIIYNKDTKKIFLMVMTTKAKIICKILSKIPFKIRLKVETITKDLANNYDWISRTMFMKAKRIADKFHVLKLGFEALQALRIKYRQELLTEERLNKKNKIKSKKLIYKNGETKKEILAKSRYLLFKKQSDWTETQAERAEILFNLYPNLWNAYLLINIFRKFYECKKYKNQLIADILLSQWFAYVQILNIEELNNFAFTVQRHRSEILNYFDKNFTNASLESLNSKIQRFIIASFGFNDRHLFHFRIKEHFS